MHFQNRKPFKYWVLPLLMLAGCDSKVASPPPENIQVSVISIKPEHVEIHEVLPGRVNALKIAEIRPQVSGIIQKRLFEQGAEIKEGTPLFQINPAPFQAEVDAAQASLLRAKAQFEKARDQAARLRPLMQAEAVSRQNYDDAVASEKSTGADVTQAKSTLKRKELDLQFATIQAPISGRIDQALVTEGAYVTTGGTDPLARIYQIDPIYVDVRQSATAYDTLRDQLSQSEQTGGRGKILPATILRANGQAIPETGKILFSGISVDANTGEVLVRIQVNNPARLLLPGMYVRASLPQKTYEQALMVPQQAVMRVNGKTQVWVIENSKAKTVNVETAELVNRKYRISHGLTAGQHVVVEGAAKLSEGASVNPVNWSDTVNKAAPTNDKQV